MNKNIKNPAAIIALLLLVITGILSPLFNIESKDKQINSNKAIFNSMQRSFGRQTPQEVPNFLLNGFFVLIIIFYFISGVGFGYTYQWYGRFASYLTFVYLIIGTYLAYKINQQIILGTTGDTSILASIGPGIYIVPIIGLLYMLFAKSLNNSMNLEY